MSDWHDATEFEKDWWDTCQNTYGEEEKQMTYAQKMGLRFSHNNKSPYNIDVKNKSILDIGGGPSSLLLKTVNLNFGTVVDPCDYPNWVAERYITAGIDYMKMKAEKITFEKLPIHSEVWIYNVLQHTEDPQLIITNARRLGLIIRIFEWIEQGVSPGHPQDLKEEKLNEWLHGEGKVEILDMPTLKGKAYYGIFPTT